MSKISERLFPALYRTLVAKPGQMQLFDAPAQPADEPADEPTCSRCNHPVDTDDCVVTGDPENPVRNYIGEEITGTFCSDRCLTETQVLA